MFMERLRRTQSNVFMGLLQTGVKMLGLGAEAAPKGKDAEITKLLLSGEQTDGTGSGAYDKVSKCSIVLPLADIAILLVLLPYCLPVIITYLYLKLHCLLTLIPPPPPPYLTSSCCLL